MVIATYGGVMFLGLRTRRSAQEHGRALLRPADIQEERARPSWVSDAPATLLLVLHVTPIGGVFAGKKGLQDGLNLLLKDRTLLIGLHRVERVP